MSDFVTRVLDTVRLESLLERIARDELGVATLQTRNSDSLDFHDLSVWQIRTALCRAYHEGRTSALLQQQEGNAP